MNKMIKSLVIMVMLSCMMVVTPKVSAENSIDTLIPSEALRNKIKKQVGKKDKDTLNFEDLLLVEEIHIGIMDGISFQDRNLEGIEHLQNLKRLTISEFVTDSLENVVKLKKLESLILNNINIQEINGISQLTSLKKLDLSWLYYGVDLTELTQLVQLEDLTVINFGNLEQLPDLSNFSNLKSLKIDYQNSKKWNYESFGEYNNIKELTLFGDVMDDLELLKHFTKVEDLKIQVESIISLEGVNFTPNLKSIEIVPISILGAEESLDLRPLEDLDTLEEIKIANRGIRSIESLKNLQNLKVLSMPENLIGDISSLKNKSSLNYIDLSLNPLDELRVDVFEQLLNLKVLKLNNTGIASLSALSNNIQINVLELDDNQIEDISVLSNMLKLESLHANNNKIESIESLNYLDKLNNVHLADNYIEDVQSLKNKSLIEVNFANNRVKDLCPVVNGQLITMNFENNEISSIECLKDNLSIQRLALDGNRIADLTILKTTDINEYREFYEQKYSFEIVWGETIDNFIKNYRSLRYDSVEVRSKDKSVYLYGSHAFIDKIDEDTTLEQLQNEIRSHTAVYGANDESGELIDDELIEINIEDVQKILINHNGNFEHTVRFQYNYEGEILELTLWIGSATERGEEIDTMQLLNREITVELYTNDESIASYNEDKKTITGNNLGETEYSWDDSDHNTVFSGSGIITVIPAKAKVHYVNLEGEEISATKLFQGKHGESIPAEELVIEDYKLVEAPIEKVFNGRMVEIYYRYRPKGEARLVSEDLTMKLSDYTKMVEAGKLPNILKELMNVRYFDEYDNEILNLEHIKVDDSKVELKKGNYVITFSENQGSKKVTTESILTLEDDQPNIEEEPGTTYNLAADDVTMTLTELKKAMDDEILDSKVILLSKAEIISSSQLRFRFLSLRSPYIFKADLQFVREEIGQYPVEISTEINGKRYAKNIVLTITDDLTQIGKIEAQNVRMHIKDYIEAKDLGKEKSVIINESKPKYTGKQVVSEDAYQLDTHLIETKAGNYKAIISVEIEGNRIETTINVELYDDNKELPKTGINSGVMLWSQMIAIGVLLLSYKKRNH